MRRVVVHDDVVLHDRGAVDHAPNLIVRAGRGEREDVARRRGAVGDVVLDVPCRRRPLRYVTRILGGGDLAGRNVQVEQRAAEDLVRCVGLVGWDLVSRLIHAAEREVAVLPHLPADVGRVGLDVRVSRGAEFPGMGVLDIQADLLPADPVARVVAVAVDEGDFDSGIQDISQIVEVSPHVGPGVVTYRGEGVVHAVDGLGEVDGDSQRALDPVLIQEANVELGRERVRVEVGDVVVTPAGVEDVGTLNVVAAELVRPAARRVDGGVVAVELGVPFVGEALALLDQVPAAARATPGVDGVVVEGLVDGLDTVGVVVRHLRVGELLRGEVHAAVDDAQRVEVDVVRLALCLDGAVGDLLVLLLEEGRERGPVAPAVGLGPDADAVVVGLVLGELGEPDLGKVPQRAGGVLGAVGRGVLVLAGERADQVHPVLLRHAVGEVADGHGAVQLVVGAVGGDVVAEADLVGLVNVEHVDVVVP